MQKAITFFPLDSGHIFFSWISYEVEGPIIILFYKNA